MFVVVWERAGGGGGHQVALTEDRAEALHRAVSRALPGVECRILPANDYADSAVESRARRQDQRQRPRRASRRG
jgi:hypothetical protein